MSAAKSATVRVDGESIDIWVAKDGRATWCAWGEFRGENFDTIGSSEWNAADRWAQKGDRIGKE